MNRVARIAGIVALAAASMACGGARSSPEVPTWEREGLRGAVRPEMGHPQPGDEAPAFDLTNLRGGTVSLASLHGSWVLLHFTATWCPYCDAEVSHLGELADAFAPRNVKVLVVDVKEERARWEDYARTHVAASVAPLFDADGTTAVRFAPPGAQPSFTDRSQVAFDSTLILDPGGRIRLFLMPDTAHFDPTFRAVRAELDRMLTENGLPEPPTLSPDRVVRIHEEEMTPVTPGSIAEVSLGLEIARGYHLMSDHPTDPSYIPTRLTLGAAEGVSVAAAEFPPPVDFHYDGRAISTFQGAVHVSLPVHVDKDATPGVRSIAGTLRYQACTPNACLFPVSVPVEVRVKVGG